VEDEIDRIVAQWRRVRPDLEPSPTYTLQRIVRADLLQTVSFTEVFARFGMTWGEYLVLAALRRAGPPYRMNPTTLFNSVVLSSGAMTNRLDRLEEMGLVRRLPDPNDRRGRLVELTVKGRELVDKAATAHLANEERLLGGMSPTDRTKLADLLRKLLLSEPFRALDPLSRAQADTEPRRSPRRKAEGAKRGRTSSGAKRRAAK
jgi:DNA-binding MarR family transcriptional regulator